MPNLRKDNTNYIDISDELTPAFFKAKEIKKGSILTFESVAGKQDFKIVRLNRAKRICLVEQVKLYTEDEINNMDRKDAEAIINEGSKA